MNLVVLLATFLLSLVSFTGLLGCAKKTRKKSHKLLSRSRRAILPPTSSSAAPSFVFDAEAAREKTESGSIMDKPKVAEAQKQDSSTTVSKKNEGGSSKEFLRSHRPLTPVSPGPTSASPVPRAPSQMVRTVSPLPGRSAENAIFTPSAEHLHVTTPVKGPAKPKSASDKSIDEKRKSLYYTTVQAVKNEGQGIFP